MVDHFDHRWTSFYGTDDDRSPEPPYYFAEKQDPAGAAEPRYWIPKMGMISTRTEGQGG